MKDLDKEISLRAILAPEAGETAVCGELRSGYPAQHKIQASKSFHPGARAGDEIVITEGYCPFKDVQGGALNIGSQMV